MPGNAETEPFTGDLDKHLPHLLRVKLKTVYTARLGKDVPEAVRIHKPEVIAMR
jgi:hypothetical protein